MISTGTKLRTALALGPANILRVTIYRAGIRFGVHPVLKITASLPVGPFFANPSVVVSGLPQPRGVTGHIRSFDWHDGPDNGQPPDWHVNPLTGVRVTSVASPWWQIPDFDPLVGDIKTIWEASRFGWLIPLAQQARLGDPNAIPKLNDWLADWCQHNPPYLGPNWKCGQEASLRLLHLSAGALLLDQVTDSQSGLLDLAEACLKRIGPTRSYAVAQDNNHGTSEAGALFVGGHWLDSNGRAAGKHLAKVGRRLLENRARRLIAPDGTFSQYSVVYHRLMLDVLSYAELWRRRFGMPVFSSEFYRRCTAATRWLHAFVDAETGDVPNLGANDGAQVLDFVQAGYRDFRPSVQLASALFLDRDAYGATGDWNGALRWLGVSKPSARLDAAASRVFDDGGFAVLHRDSIKAVLRYPRFQFRPGQADALHVDLSVAGVNHLRDGGTYSYNGGDSWLSYFGGAQSHNTVIFDNHDQMPRLGRFLYGDWLKTDSVIPLTQTGTSDAFGAGYHNQWGSHFRNIEIFAGHLAVVDRLGAFSRSAVMRWRLTPGDWTIEGHTVTCGSNRLAVVSEAPILRFELVQGWESRYYLERTNLPVLEVEIGTPGTVTTAYSWMR